ncbi:MAG TPA: hypothetical protein VL087_11320 [Nitrospirota bacterium]|nr:hypothetical protein [Nitrospirota bacterium]
MATRKGNTTGRDRPLVFVVATDVHRQAINIIMHKEQDHHYPFEQISQERRACTAYHFRYLYPSVTSFLGARGRTGTATSFRCRFDDNLIFPEERGYLASRV